MSPTPELLREIPLFVSMDEEERGGLARIMEEVRFADGAALFHERDPGGICYVIKAGRVELSVKDELGAKLVVSTLGEGELFGELSLLDGGLRSTSATAVDAVEALALKRADLIQFLKKYPDASLDLLSALSARLRRADLLLKQRVQDPNKIIDEKMTLGEHLADVVAAFGGSWSFVIIFVSGMVVWMTGNTLLGWNVDPFPYILLNLLLSMLAALQGPVIMMSQNRQDSKDRIRSEADYMVNLKAEAGVVQLHDKIDRLRGDIFSHLESLKKEL